MPGSVIYLGAPLASGTFTGGLSAGIGIESGIIMTTGDANLAPGPNDSESAGVNNGLPGDADLEGLIPGLTTYDATILEFDFETTGGDLFFDYVFASEEYNEYVNSQYNDVFGFFLNGVNIALIPGTSIPVAINTVNGGNPLGVDASHPEFFHNNSLFGGGPFFDIQYDGFTHVFSAYALGIGAGIHSIKLAIADGGDGILDSAVFIKGGSFSDVNTVPEPSAIILLLTGFAGMLVYRRRR